MGSADECWPWIAGVAGKGYGQFYLRKTMPVGAHRLAWELANAMEVPLGLQVCHRCDNPPCCNPAHLFVGTASDNRRDQTVKGRNLGNRRPRRRGPRKFCLNDAVELRGLGLSYAAIGSRLGVSGSTVFRALDPRNAELALERVGPLFLTIDTGERDGRGTEDVATGGYV